MLKVSPYLTSNYIILYSHNYKNSMVLAQQTQRLMEQNRRLRNKPTKLQAANLLQRNQKQILEKREFSKQIVLRKLDIYM
jgi:hypothetical protein